MSMVIIISGIDKVVGVAIETKYVIETHLIGDTVLITL